ncbi:hypothetical protein I79_020720, partial [Cricetulus griseus]
ETPGEELDNRSLEEILNSIPPPPPPAMASEAGAPRLMITHIVNQNFKSYAGEKILGPFHKRFSCIIGPNGSGKSNVIDSMLFVFGYRAQKIRSKKLSVLIHNSDEHKDIQSCTVEVHFQKIIDKEGDDYEVIPNSNFYVSRTAYRDNTSVYHISGKKRTFKDVGNLLRSHGIDLDHNRFLILQVEELKSIPAKSKDIINETTTKNNSLEKEREKEEKKLKEVMDSLKQETQGLQKEKEGDLGAIDEKYDIAISSCCHALDYIVVDSIDTAQECVNFLKRHNIGVATFIGLDKMAVWAKKMTKIQTPENTPRLFDLVKVNNEEIRQAFYFALRDTLVADNLDQATRVAYQKDRRWRVVTLQGQIIEQSGTMTGGGSKVMKGRMGSSVIVEISEEEVNKMESQLERHSKQAMQIQEQKVQHEEAVIKLRHSEREMRNTLEKFTASIQGLSEQEEYLALQIKELEANVITTAPDKKKQKLLEENVSAFKKEYDAVAEKAGKVEAEVKRLHDTIIEINNRKLKTQQNKLDMINKQLDECASAITKAQVAIKTADRNLKKAQDSVLRTEKEIKDTEKETNDLRAELKNVEDKAEEVIKTTNTAEESLPEIQKEHRNLLQELKVIQENEHALQKDALSIKLKLEQIDGQIAEHNSKIKYWQKEISKIKLHPVEDSPVETVSVLSPEDLEAIKNPDSITNQIALLEAQCHEMKPNLGAIAEYKKKEELYLQRVAELDKITSERDSFRQAYEDLRKQRLNEFMAGFYIITNKLKENYQMLTLGGDAELELVDSLDPFSEGIMFSVRPPKKSWKKIFNLSGGEKTLSSLALVFALHHYKPTPLYFMDEIDAALDFKNVSIVAFYIYEQTKNAQFIIISLRNNMFEISDRLIGIYKTYNITKSVAVNPKEIASKGLC